MSNNTTSLEQVMKMFDDFMGKLPQRVNETPRECLQDFIKTVYSMGRQSALDEVLEKMPERPAIPYPYTSFFSDNKKEFYTACGFDDCLSEIKSIIKQIK